jgi:hypothetical protein
MNHEPTVTEMVDRIMGLDCGDSCNVRLDPHITRIGNLEWLLPICVRQFGTEIAIRERPEGDIVVLTITATATRKRKSCQPATPARSIIESEEQLDAVADDTLAAVA